MRLIDADYTKEHLRASELNGRRLHIMELEERLAVIDEVPTIDAEPVRHGYWIEVYDDKTACKCSCCGHEYNLYEEDINGYSYCANCGAKMDGESNEQ